MKRHLITALLLASPIGLVAVGVPCDGRELEGCVGTLIAAEKVTNLLIANSVFIGGMNEAFSLDACPEATMRHCVFYNNFRTKFRQDQTSRTGNPSIPAAPRLVPRNHGENPEWRKIKTAWRETELHQTSSTLTPLHFEDFIPAAENPLSKTSDGKPVGLEPTNFALLKDRP